LSQQSTRHVPFRAVRMGECRAIVEELGGGELLVRNVDPLPDYPRHLTERLDHWAKTHPDRIWLAARNAAGGWDKVTYAEGRARVRRIATALTHRHLPCAARHRGALLRYSLRADFDGLFADLV
jgi:feruloyl-CoA synthase